MKFALAQMRSEIEKNLAKMETEMKDVKENLSALTDSIEESKDEGQ